MDDTITRYQGGTPPGADQKPVNQALQGGGSHGAFAWGVLDKLLEDGRLTIDAMSATSAGAMNAVVTAYGLSIGGANGAGEKLEEFWRQVSSAGQLYSRFCGRHGRTVAGPTWTFRRHSFLFQAMTHVFSPYQINPFNLNPLKSVLSEVVDFDRLAKCKMAPRLFLSATNVRTGKAKVFENDAMSIDVVLALRPSSIEIGTSCVACVTAVAQRRPSGWTPISTRSGNRPRSISPRFFLGASPPRSACLRSGAGRETGASYPCVLHSLW